MSEAEHKEDIAAIEDYFSGLVIEILRGVANGYKRNPDIGYFLFKIALEADKLSPREIDQLADRVICRASETIDADNLISHVVQSALRFAAELNAPDNAARGRASQRRTTLTHAISGYESHMQHLRGRFGST